MIDFRYVKIVKPDSILHHTYNDISIKSFKKLIDKLCVSGEIENEIVIKTSLKMMQMVPIILRC